MPSNRFLPYLALPAIVLALVVLVVLLLVGLPWWAALVLGLIAGAALFLWVARTTDGRALGSLHVAELRAEEHPRLFNVAEGLVASHGFTEARLTYVNDESRNAAALVDASGPTLVFTRGLLGALDRMELEALLAHLFALTRRDGQADATTTAGLSLLAPGALGSALRDRLVVNRVPFVADEEGVSITRYPPAMIKVLEKVASGSTVVASASPATAHLWIADPLGAGSETVYDRAPLGQRIDFLREL